MIRHGNRSTGKRKDDWKIKSNYEPDRVIDGDVESAFIEFVRTDVDARETDSTSTPVSRFVFTIDNKIKS